MSRAASPFSPGKMALVLLVGAGAFLLLLYALAEGWTGDTNDRNTAHANSNALNGFKGLVTLLEERDYDVSLSRNRDMGEIDALLVLTPSTDTDPDELQNVLEQRRYLGPTLVILPKWASAPLPNEAPEGTPDDWVQLGFGIGAAWFEQVDDLEPMTLRVGETHGWRGLGLTGDLPVNITAQAITEIPDKQLFPLVRDTEGDLLAGYWNRNGYHPDLAEAAGVQFSDEEWDNQDEELWPLVIVAEPDLFNNYGLADRNRALLALNLIELTLEDYDLPIVFDMTMPGFGGGENLLTLAFRPPFLAATLCLLLAALVIAWRAFRRFGPPLAEIPAFTHGKTQLARNGAALVERTRRWHLLGAPYAVLVSRRIATALHIREADEMAREAAIDDALKAHGLEDIAFTQTAEVLRHARRPAEILRAASALRSIERMLKR
jgi:hypothetical protein